MLFRRILAIACSLLTAHAQAPRSGDLQQKLPTPSGSYRIGQTSFDWIDPTRVDPFSTAPEKHRELMVYVWYPAQASSGQRAVSAYVPAAQEIDHNAAAREAAQDVFGQPWPAIVAGSLHAHAMPEAPVVRTIKEQNGFPVILFSPGSSASQFSYTAQIENFVSHGYIVVAVDHPGLSGLVRFADGRIRLSDPNKPPAPGEDPLQVMIASAQAGTQFAAEDLSFVLDQLAKLHMPLRRAMNLSRVAAVGHSAGGTLSVRACQLDQRIKACVSEDGQINPVGAFFDYPDHTKLSQPLFQIQIAEEHTDEELKRMGGTRDGWNAYLDHERLQLAACAPGSYLAMITKPGLHHSAFSDGPLLNAKPASPEGSAASSNLQLTEDLELAFLDGQLKPTSHRTLASLKLPTSDVSIQPVGR